MLENSSFKYEINDVPSSADMTRDIALMSYRMRLMQRPLFDSGEVVLNVNKGAAVTMAGSSHLNCALAGYRSNLDDTSRT